VARQVEGERFQFHNYPVNQLAGVQNEFPLSWRILTGSLRSAIAITTCNALALPAKFDQTLEGLKLREAKGIIPPWCTRRC
jgi:hypothetical protein